VNAWSEIAAMVASLVVAIAFFIARMPQFVMWLVAFVVSAYGVARLLGAYFRAPNAHHISERS